MKFKNVDRKGYPYFCVALVIFLFGMSYIDNLESSGLVISTCFWELSCEE